MPILARVCLGFALLVALAQITWEMALAEVAAWRAVSEFSRRSGESRRSASKHSLKRSSTVRS
jgi:uncharacterized membrane protein (DUF485 family)